MSTVKYHFIIFLLIFCCTQHNIFAQKKIEIIKLENFFDKIEKNNDTLYIVNFWATWCAPCVKELPDFEQLNSVYKKDKIKILLISIDFKSEIGKVRNFVNKRMMQTEVVLLDEPKYNEWIDKIDPTWEGQIPVTLFYKNKQKLAFIASETNFTNLEILLKKFQ